MTEKQTALQNSRDRNLNRVKLLMLWLVPIGLMGIAWLCYFLVQNGYMSIGSTNNGVLLDPPIQMNELFSEEITLKAKDNTSTWNGKWTLVIRGNEHCEASCRKSLYQSRQLHIRLDKNANRVKRVYLSDKLPLSDELQNHIEAEHVFLKVATANKAQLNTLDTAIDSTINEPTQFFLVDPEGWAMMVYHQAHEGNAILKDLKYLLKYSVEK